MGSRIRHDRGQALPLLLVVLAVSLIAMAVVARLGGVADEAARARTAADAAALAGAADGPSAARRLAESNGGVLVDYLAEGATFEVVVRIGSSAARARAEVIVEWSP